MSLLRMKAQRCRNCNKMLFRGTLGMGMIEIKCSRCSFISTFHSLDTMLRNKTNSYAIVYNPEGRIILASDSVEQLLGYTKDDLGKLSIQDISPKNQLYQTIKRSNPIALDEWERYHAQLPSDIIHIAKSGEIIEVSARFFPMASYKDFYTVGIYQKGN